MINVAWQQADTYSAAMDRSVIRAVAYPDSDTSVRDGVLTLGGLTPSHTTGMQVKVTPGQAMVAGYLVTVDPAVTVTLDVGGAQKRTDLIVLRVYDEAEGDTNSEGAVEVVKGPAGGAVPAVPARSLLLAQAAITATASTLDPGDLTDHRVWTTGRGGILYLPGALDDEPPEWMDDGQAVFDGGRVGVKSGPGWKVARREGDTTPVSDGGTGRSTLTSGSYLRGNAAGAVTLRTPGQVLSDISGVPTSRSISAEVGLSGGGSLAADRSVRVRARTDVWSLAPSLAIDPDAWEMSGGASIQGAGSAFDGQRINFPDSGSPAAAGPRRQVRPGDTIYVSAYVNFNAGASSTMVVRVHFYDASDLYLSGAVIGTRAFGSGAGTVSGSTVVPSGATCAMIYLLPTHDGAGSFCIAQDVSASVQPAVADTGWLNCTMQQQGQVQARVLNGVVYFKGQAIYPVSPGQTNMPIKLFTLPGSIPNPPDDMGSNPATWNLGLNWHGGALSILGSNPGSSSITLRMYGQMIPPYPAA